MSFENGEQFMTYPVPAYLTPFIMTGMILVIATLTLVLRRALFRAAWPKAVQAKAFWSVSALLVGWFVVAAATSIAGFYRPASGPPTIQYGLLTPIVVGVLAFVTWPLLRRIVASIPSTWLVGVQFYRVLGIIFVVLYAGRHLPGIFALPAGVGDTLVGILAPFAAVSLARSPEGSARRVRLWNLLGIADLTIAVTLGASLKNLGQDQKAGHRSLRTDRMIPGLQSQGFESSGESNMKRIFGIQR